LRARIQQHKAARAGLAVNQPDVHSRKAFDAADAVGFRFATMMPCSQDAEAEFLSGASNSIHGAALIRRDALC
jgi:hypothetical protein